MADQKYDEMMARYFADMEKQSRKRLAEAADLIAKFMAMAATKGMILSAESFEYIPTIGIVAKAQDIARTLLGPIKPSATDCCRSTRLRADFLPAPITKDALPGPTLS